MRMRRHHQQDEDTGIDLTPMLDVVFIMLIFFIVTSSFIKESGVEVQRPQAGTQKHRQIRRPHRTVNDAEARPLRHLVRRHARRAQLRHHQ